MLYSELQCSDAIHKAVERMGFTELTEVQEKAIPPMLAGRDVIAKAPTGTGKTCAFGIPLILGVQQEKHYPQAVVMAPTRELAQQITEDLRDLAHFYPDIRIVCVYGGANMAKQVEQLKKGPQIVVANKTDLLGGDRAPLERLKAYADEKGFDFLELSAATNQGVHDLIMKTWEALQELPPVFIYEPEYVPAEQEVTERDITVEKVEDYYVVGGAWIEKIMGSVNTDDYESRQYMDRMLKNAGVYDRLEAMGIQEGDFVVIGDLEFEYVH